ncbi:type I restriction-modification system subunit M N-terminal domain-containing protein [Nostoc sp. LEGE 06077]|uniref:type I restriction-modification system subunit M N-terminal domain-containing protein n=1 Tax=Nostoc sp. LEGE 06077 TaxID=915325 RepID=UPI001D13D49E|nr:type I restriction-modification system subunit M N-terminal domain-containing protein [Nostoc sp. LEGE 06077]
MVASIENSHNQELVGFIWSIADKLCGPYRPPQYRRVMLPLIVLRRLDAVLEPTKQAVLEAKGKYEAMGLTGDAFEKAIAITNLSTPQKMTLIYHVVKQPRRSLDLSNFIPTTSPKK